MITVSFLNALDRKKNKYYADIVQNPHFTLGYFQTSRWYCKLPCKHVSDTYAKLQLQHY